MKWFIWASLTYFIETFLTYFIETFIYRFKALFSGTRLLPEPQTKADYWELLRTIGFSSSPGVLRVLGIIPMLGNILNIIIGIWMLVAMFIAIRQALYDKSTWRAVGICLFGWCVQIPIFGLFFLLVGGF